MCKILFENGCRSGELVHMKISEYEKKRILDDKIIIKVLN